MQGKTSHKFFDPNENFIMRLYYQKDVLTFMCFFNEMFYSGLYLLNFTTGPTRKFNVHPTLQINRLKPIFFLLLQFWESLYSKYLQLSHFLWPLQNLLYHCCMLMSLQITWLSSMSRNVKKPANVIPLKNQNK